LINLIIWPLVILIIIVVAVALRKNMHKIIKAKYRKQLLATYIALLLLMTVIYLFVQPKETTVTEKTDTSPYLLDMIDQSIDNTRLESYKAKEWTMPLSDNKLTIHVSSKGNKSEQIVPVFVMEDEQLTDMAVISHYETPSVLNNIDITKDLPNIDVDVAEGDVLLYYPPLQGEYVYQAIHKDMVIYQFSGQSDDDVYFDFYPGETALIMFVPERTVIAADLRHVEIIRK